MALSPSMPGKAGHVYELEPAVAAHWFGDTGTYARMGVTGDGSCFYHSVCAQLNIDDYLHQPAHAQAEIAHTFRCQFQRAFSKEHFTYLAAGSKAGKTYAKTRDALCSPEVWADEVMIKQAASVLNMNLLFLDMSTGKLYCGVHGAETLEAASPRRRGAAPAKPKQPTAVVAWVSKSHFEPVVRIEKIEPDRALVRGVFEPSKNKTDAAMVAHVMAAYTAQCSPAVHDAHV